MRSGAGWRLAAVVFPIALALHVAAAGAQTSGAAPGAPAPAAKTKGAGGAGDADLRRRVEQLEEQLIDLQVVIGTLESFARSGGGGGPAPRVTAPAGLSSADNARIEGLETQVRALTSQIEQLQSGRPAGTAALPAPAPYGSATVNAGQGDPIGGLLSQDDATAVPPVSPPVSAPVGERAFPPAPPVAQPGGGGVAAVEPGGAGDPKQAYEQAYGYLLQQDYGAAQAGFTDFLKSYPRDSLTPNALYWLGETHYVQRNYADAAEAFDLVMQGFGNSPKAPDSMLKRGMALAALGKKGEACGVLGQLPGKYPSAPAHIKSKADGERQRLGCP